MNPRVKITPPRSGPKRSLAEDSARLPSKRTDKTNPLGGIAFVGTATLPVDDMTIHVSALCWPTIATAWTSLDHTWQIMYASRAPVRSNEAPSSPSSWIAACAPELGTPFKGTTAEESSIAALLGRTSMQVATAFLEVKRACRDTVSVPDSTQYQALSECLALYDGYLRGPPKRRACDVLIARGGDEESNERYASAFDRCGQRFPGSEWRPSLGLKFWANLREPLALEAAQVIAGAIARYRLDSSNSHLIVDAIRAKLVHTPTWLRLPTSSKRR